MGDMSRTAVRNRSPVATCGMPSRSERMSAWVPLPAPGAPSRTTTVTRLGRRPPPGTVAASSDEAFVVAHHELRFDLLHRLDDDRHDDQQPRTAEGDARQGGIEDAGDDRARGP